MCIDSLSIYNRVQQWRNRDINVDQISDKAYRQLLTSAIGCEFEVFRQRVLSTTQDLQQLSSDNPSSTNRNEALTISIIADPSDLDLAKRLSELLVELGTDSIIAPTSPSPDQSPIEFNAQFNEIIAGSEGVIFVYGRSSPVWVQAQYMRARRLLAPTRKGIWGAELIGPPLDKPEISLQSKNLMTIDCRDGLSRHEIERFVNIVNHEADGYS